MRENTIAQGSENVTVTNKAVVMGTRAQATANVTTRRRLADVSNAIAGRANLGPEKPVNVDAENKPPQQQVKTPRKRSDEMMTSSQQVKVSRKRSREMMISPDKENIGAKTQELKPSLGLKKSLATKNLLAPPAAAPQQQKQEAKETNKEEAVCQEAYSANSLRNFVEDIDAADGDNPQLCAEYVKDIYGYLRQLERDYAVTADYLAVPSTTTTTTKTKPEINGKMRAILIDWLIQVHQRFSLLQETLYLTIAILDRYLQSRFSDVKRKKLQLVGVTCMWVASKYEEMYAPEINDFVYITDSAYTSLEIRQMELDVLRALDFNLGKPLPLHFLRRNSKAAGVDAVQHNFAKFFMEMTLQEYSFAHITPSQLAAAALCLSCRIVNEDNVEKIGIGKVEKLKWEEKMVHYSGYSETELEPLMSSIAFFVVKSETNRLNFVKQKYQSSKFMRISTSPLLKTKSFVMMAESAKALPSSSASLSVASSTTK